MRPDLIDKLHGTLVPIVTPMHNDFSLKLDVLPTLIDYLIDGGVKVIIPCGSTGEFYALSEQERCQMIEATVKAVAGRISVIAGVSDTRKDTVIRLANFAKDSGADGVMILAPYYFLSTEDELFAFMKAIDEAIDIPFLYYNNPATTKFNASLDFLERLSTLINFGAIKENNSQPVRYYEELQRFGNKFPVIPAGEPPAIFNMLSGAPGFMSVAANFNPKLISDMLVAAREQRIQDAFALFEILRTYRSIFEARNRQGYPEYVRFAKASLNLIGFPVGPTRLPLLAPSDQDLMKLRKILSEVMHLQVVN